MSDGPAYVLLGRGRWSTRMQGLLFAENRRVTTIAETRRTIDESDDIYRTRLSKAMTACSAQIAWLCVPPGPHIALMVEAALDSGLHVIVEKPWQCSKRLTESLATKAKLLRRLVAIHFEYCLLDEVERWHRDFHPGNSLRFGGRFLLGRRDHLGIPAIENLGSHLLSIHAYAVPKSALQEIRCGYEQPDERYVWLEKRNTRVAFIDLLANKEPIIQRFIARFEASLDNQDFPFNLDFAMRVMDDTRALR